MKNEMMVTPFKGPLKTEQQQHEFLEETREMAITTSFANILLAGRLYRIKEEKLWQAGYDSWDDYLMDLKVKPAKATKLMKVHKKFILDYGIKPEKAAEVGYTVLYNAHNVIEDKEDAKEFVENAIKMTSTDTTRIIEERKAVNKIEDCEHKNTYTVRICKDCGDRWKEGEHLHTEDE